MNINDILQKFPELKELIEEITSLKDNLSKVEVQNKKNEDEILQLTDLLKKREDELLKIIEKNPQCKENSLIEAEIETSIENTVIEEEFEKLNLSLTTSFDKVKEFIHDLDYKDKINKELHEELQLYKNGFRKEITTPILKNIIHWHDRIVDLHKFYDKNTETDKEILFPKLLQEYKNLSTGLLDMLYDYDIEPFDVQPNEDYSPKMHKAIDVIVTDDESKSKKIAECKKEGFSDVTTGRILRPSEVIIYKVQNNL